jgi:hypothetical protein
MERAAPVTGWTIGHTAVAAGDRPFLGAELRVWTAHAPQGEI